MNDKRFSRVTDIEFALPESGHVQLLVYDALGKVVSVLMDREQGAGRYAMTWEAGVLPSGLYLYRLKAGAFIQVRQMMLVK